MAIITISRGSFSKGKEVAEKVAEKLNYTNVSREIIIEASEEFNVPEVKLARAIHDAPSIFERLTYGKERYLAYIASALLDRFQKDNIVYHGLAGHFFVKNISHLLKIRVIADLEDRIQTEMALNKVSRSEALAQLKKDDRERREWSLRLYGVDTWDPGLYDQILHIRKLTIDNVVDIICNTIKLDQFRTTPASRKALYNLALAARVKAGIVKGYPNCKVSSHDGAVRIQIPNSTSLEPEIVEEISCLARKVPGVEEVSVHLTPTTLFGQTD